ncbi:MAG: 50S ribosomal protein L30e [Candidatus Nezhaarchaeota archaeon]|nr:50S ribosomal protein L30e [Candidatus Nezhaarchaeota archaeon]
MTSIENELRIAIKTGKILLGSKETMRAVARGQGKLVILSRNCPDDIRKLVAYYAKLSGIPMRISSLSSWELGAACGKSFMVAALTVLDEGDSDILKIAEEGG